MKRLLLLNKSKNHERLNHKIKTTLAEQLALVGSLSTACQQLTMAQLTECLPLLLTFSPRAIEGWQDQEHHGAALSLRFAGGYRLLITVFCPPHDAQAWYPDTKIFVYHYAQLVTYLACHHGHLCAALHRSLQVLSQKSAQAKQLQP
ncbi:hypothetical protein [Hymenobacter chitinivorans]|uniref:Uncharacterized protein n=1 Tax=Hymenobacter chitinivorans DSM 11115 TaxID=1121954 RepID=A0A2M9BRB8_9BACT|nr:hypothetical protein [Hymenobacter chitinivorans]PJJ60495.1 hypothetical protein CLV45_1924 [Hymenobacter chitinivorans DSM 11115]